MNNKTKFLKFGIAALLGAGAVGILYAQLSIPTNIDNAVMTIKQINITPDGQASEPKIVIDGSATDSNYLKVEGSILMGSITGAASQLNKVSGAKSSVLGGVKNTLNGNFSIIPGGSYNQITGDDSFAFGNTVRVNGNQSYGIGKSLILNGNNSFLFSDGYSSNFTVSKNNVFIIKVNNGVGINTGVTTTGYDLTVNGSGIVYGNLKTNNMIAGAYYYQAITNNDDMYNLKLSQWEGTGDIYYDSGYVGIGTNNPTAQLHVDGNVRLTNLSPSTENTALVIDTNGYVTTRSLNAIAFNGYTAPVTSVAGKVGAVTLVKGDVGLGNVDNTSDLNKPISTATQSALDLKAPLASPVLTGIPTAPTAASGSNSQQIATTAFVKAQGYITNATAPVTSVAGRLGDVVLTKTDVGLGNVDNTSDLNKPISTATQAALNLKASLASPSFSGTPTAPNPSNGDNSTTIATTAFVKAQGYITNASEIDPTVNALAKASLGCSVNQIAKYNGTTWACAADNDTTYTHPTSGVGAGTYRSVTVNTLGHVTAGTNPTTLAGYGITDAVNTTSTQIVGGAKTFTNTTLNGVSFFNIGEMDNTFVVYDGPNGEAALRIDNDSSHSIILTDGNLYNVGIGTATPGAKLDVNGEIRTRDKFRLGTANNYMFTNAGYLGLFSAGNEITIGGGTNTLYVNYRAAGGTTTPANWIWNAGASNLYANHTMGNITSVGTVTATAFYYSSDKSLKKDLIKISNPLDKIIALNGYYFTWKKDNTKDIGVVAQEVEKVFPEAVKTDDKGLKSVKYGNLIAPVIEAIKELYNKYLDQQDKISTLEKRIEILEKSINK